MRAPAYRSLIVPRKPLPLCSARSLCLFLSASFLPRKPNHSKTQVVFISTVIGRNKRLNSEIGRTGNTGLMGSAKRFNVAITRAKALLVVSL